MESILQGHIYYIINNDCITGCDGQPGVIMYLNWFMLLYDEIPLMSGGDVAEIKGKNIRCHKNENKNNKYYIDLELKNLL
jgi:hypothetical protein